MRNIIFIVFGLLISQISISQEKKNMRPQTPVPPYSYKTDSLVYTADSDTLRYGVSLSIPTGKGPFPAIILITGSGQQDRDETIMNHKPFAVLADYLTR